MLCTYTMHNHYLQCTGTVLNNNKHKHTWYLREVEKKFIPMFTYFITWLLRTHSSVYNTVLRLTL